MGDNPPGFTESSVKIGEGDDAVKCLVSTNFGDSLSEMTELYGEEVVFGHALIGMKTQLRNKAYSYSQSEGASEEGLASLVDAHTPTKPSAGGAKKSKAEKIAEMFSDLPEDEREALLELIG